MLLKICLLGCLAMLVAAEELPAIAGSKDSVADESRLDIPFETSHKHPDGGETGFHTAHKITVRATDAADYSMNLLPTKERPELNPVLSALINEDVMKSIEAKRAIELEELEEVRREIEEAAAAELEQKATTTEAPLVQLTTVAAATKKIDDLDDDINVGFVDQTINLDTAGTENNKKSRIEIKKGPNGQDYEYEYVYYYEDEDDASEGSSKPTKAAATTTAEQPAPAETPEVRGKTRYTNIERNSAAPSENSLQSGKAKGRASSVSDASATASDDIEAERLPTNTRFPSRGKNIEVQPTPALDSLENAAERKKISVKRPSLELVDSQTFNTDEKQAKGTRNGDNELKPAIAIEQEQAAAAAAAAAAKSAANDEEKEITARLDDDAEQTTPSMEKAALDLYAILTNENLNNEQTTASSDGDATTLSPDTASTDAEDGSLSTLPEELASSTPSTTTSTTTTTTTTEAPTTTTTTTTTAAPSLYGGRRGLNSLAGRNRFKLNRDASTSTTTEAPSEVPKGRNRYSRPSIGGRSRPAARTTASPEATSAATAAAEEEVVAVKEVKPVSSGFGRGRPRNRFNLRGSTTTTTTEKPVEESAADGQEEAAVSSTTARSLRGRPGLSLRGRSRTTTTKAPATAEGEEGSAEEAVKAAPSATPTHHADAAAVRPSRFNIHRAGGSNRLLPRGKLGRAGATTEAAPKDAEDSAADSSHHNDVKGGDAGGENAGEGAEKTEGDAAAGSAANHAGPVSGFNRLKNRPRLNALHKTDAAAKSRAAAAAPAPSAAPASAARKINPLLAKRRLQLGGAAAAATSTTETPAEEDGAAASGEQSAKEEAPTASVASGSEEGSDSAAKEQDTTEPTETTTKQQARGLGLLGQRRRLPLRKPGTIL